MAKKFRFRLEPVLKLRTDKVSDARAALKTILQYRISKEEEIIALNAIKHNVLMESEAASKAAQMQATRDYVQNLDTQIKVKEEEKEKLVEIENERRARLNEAIKEEKVILKLKEKKLAEYQQELIKEETKFLDEIASNKFIKHQKEQQ